MVGASEILATVSLATTSNMSYFFPVAVALTIDGASRAGAGEGIIASTRSIGRVIVEYFRKQYTQ